MGAGSCAFVAGSLAIISSSHAQPSREALPPPDPTGIMPPSQALAPPAPEPGERFSLDQALTAMRRSHPLVLAARANLTFARGSAAALGLWQNPVLDATYQRGIRQTGLDAAGAVNVGITQFLDLAGAPAARRRAAEQEAAAVQADLEMVQRDLALDVTEAFVQLAAATARRQVLRDTVADLERADRIVRARWGGGVTPHYDVSRIAIALADAHAAVSEAESDMARARGALDVAVGPDAGALHGLPAYDFEASPQIPPLAAMQELARTRRPDVVAARHRATAADEQIGVAQRNVFPGFGVRVGAGFGNNPGQLDLQIGVVVPLPLLDRGQAAVPAARARADAAAHQATAIALATDQRIAAAHAEATRRREALDRYRDASRSLSAGMRSEAEAGYREARLSVLELVDAYSSVRDARLRLVGLSVDARLAELALRRAVGVAP